MLPGLSIIIPVYRSAAILPELAARLSKTLPGLASAYEVILVCDGSPDDSWKIIKDISLQYNFIRGINLSKNYGQHNALLIGIRDAQYGIIVTMDDDLQHPPEEIHKLLGKLESGYDVIYGVPEEMKHAAARNISSVMIKYIIRQMIGYKNASEINAFRAFRTDLREAFSGYRDKFVSIDVLLTWGTSKFSSVPVKHNERHSGVSGYSYRKLAFYAVNIITSFSSLPLQFASMVGFLFLLFGIAVFLYVTISYLMHGGSVPGFTFLASLISIFSGAQLFSLGIMGEYLSRIHFRSMGQPYGVIRERTDSPR
jgi:glycosyltransferase involved in cell wall biosynthesis